MRKQLTDSESMAAFLAAGGLFLLMIGFLMASATGGNQPQVPVLNIPSIPLMMLGGVALLLGGLAYWLAASRPWQTGHDDWSTPLYTGHEGHHEAHHDAVHEALPDAYDAHGDAAADAGQHVEGGHETIPATLGQAVVVADAPSLAETPLPVEPPSAAASASRAADDLTVVEGIGPKIAAALAAAGITTFAGLAALSATDLEHIVKSAGVRMVGKAATWPDQARLLAEGRVDEWKALASRLKAGH